jgi:hypothetical protein
MKATTPRTCGATTKAGTSCRSTMNLSPTNGRCLQHDPERIAEARALHVMGAKARGAAAQRAKAADPATVPKPPQTLEDAVQWSSWAMHACATGAMDARTGHEVGYLVARFTEALNKRDLLRKIEELERALATAKKETPRPVLGVSRGGSR